MRPRAPGRTACARRRRLLSWKIALDEVDIDSRLDEGSCTREHRLCEEATRRSLLHVSGGGQVEADDPPWAIAGDPPFRAIDQTGT
jgi:hypothetical protein